MYDIPECCLYKYSQNMFPFFSIRFHISNNLLPVIISHILKTLCSSVYGGTTVMTHLTYCTCNVYITFFFIIYLLKVCSLMFIEFFTTTMHGFSLPSYLQVKC